MYLWLQYLILWTSAFIFRRLLGDWVPSKMLPSCPRAFVPANECIACFENLQKLEKLLVPGSKIFKASQKQRRNMQEWLWWRLPQGRSAKIADQARRASATDQVMRKCWNSSEHTEGEGKLSKYAFIGQLEAHCKVGLQSEVLCSVHCQ